MTTSWIERPLLEVCDAYQPKTITMKDMVKDGPYLVYGANGVIGRYDNFNHEEAEILLGCRGTCGAVNVSQPKSWITGNAMVIRPKGREISRQFLKYYLEGAARFAGIITGVAQPQITRKSLAPLKIKYPSLHEQQRIVAILDEAFAGLATATANAEKNLKNARELFDSYLSSVFTQKGGGWVRRQIGDVATTQYGLSGTLNSDGDGYKIFRMGEVQDGVLVDTGRMKFIEIDNVEFEPYRLRPGDVLFNRRTAQIWWARRVFLIWMVTIASPRIS